MRDYSKRIFARWFDPKERVPYDEGFGALQ
jgi:hypothetical protein